MGSYVCILLLSIIVLLFSYITLILYHTKANLVKNGALLFLKIFAHSGPKRGWPDLRSPIVSASTKHLASAVAVQKFPRLLL
jgi:hypothetical protein